MELKVGMYVRFKPELKEKICKIKKFIDDGFLVLIDGTEYWFEESDVIKANFNITYLMEVGDVVVGKDGHKFEVYAVGNNCVYINELKEFILIDEIEEVVTKEQFESISYKVGE